MDPATVYLESKNPPIVTDPYAPVFEPVDSVD